MKTPKEKQMKLLDKYIDAQKPPEMMVLYVPEFDDFCIVNFLTKTIRPLNSDEEHPLLRRYLDVFLTPKNL